MEGLVIVETSTQIQIFLLKVLETDTNWRYEMSEDELAQMNWSWMNLIRNSFITRCLQILVYCLSTI